MCVGAHWQFADGVNTPACALSLTCRYKPAIIQHCLQVYGCSTAQPDASQASAGPGPNSSSSSYVLDARQVCLHYARKLLQQRAVWPLHDFLPAWQQAVPGGCWEPNEGMLAGEALVLHPADSEGGWTCGFLCVKRSSVSRCCKNCWISSWISSWISCSVCHMSCRVWWFTSTSLHAYAWAG